MPEGVRTAQGCREKASESFSFHGHSLTGTERFRAVQREGFFRGLRNISTSDKILLTTMKGTYQYRVHRVEIVNPKDIRVLAPTPQSSLTLVTCHPFYFVGNAPERFIVRAQLIER